MSFKHWIDIHSNVDYGSEELMLINPWINSVALAILHVALTEMLKIWMRKLVYRAYLRG
jgi:hypothetical protein